MRIIRLQAEGFKRIVCVDITPEGDLVEVRGNNGNGKSSVLDAIFAALGGADAAPDKPVREGEEAAVIKVDLGELLVTRYFTAHGTTGLKVTNREGFEARGAQTMLDELVGHISFDPLAFLSLKPGEQAEELRKLVELVDPETGEVLDLKALDDANAADYAKRRDVNRDAQSLKARIEALGGLRHVPDDAPDRAELLSQMESAAATNTERARELERRESRDRRLAELEVEIGALEQRLAALKTERSGMADAKGREEPVGDPVDVAELRSQIAEAERIAENKRVNDQREALLAEFEELRTRSTALSTAMTERNDKRAVAMAAAKMPVEGLALVVRDGELGVEFAGVPFSQASDAERLRVAVGVAMAANPKLRVLRLKDASLLDKGAVAALRQLAADNEFQIWAEFVGDEGPGIIMEAGEVRGAEKPEPLPKPRQRKKADEGEVREGERAEAVSHETPVAGGPGGEVPAKRETLFERMADASREEPAPERKRPTALTEFTTKPRGQQ